VTFGAYRTRSRFANVSLGHTPHSGPESGPGCSFGLAREVLYILEIVFWHWWILSGLLIVFELFSPRFIFLWLGFAAASVGFLLLVFPSIPLRVQLGLFGGLFLIAMVSWHRYHGR
jgi:hypothetical protein